MKARDIYFNSAGYKTCITVFVDEEKRKERVEILDKEKKEDKIVIFLPGTMANPYTYWDYIEELVKYGHIVLGLHYIGHGNSSREKKCFRLRDVETNILDTIDFVYYNREMLGAKENSKIILQGHSQGGILTANVVGKTNKINKYVIGNLIISDMPENKKMLKMDKYPDFVIPLIRLIVKIAGKIMPAKMLKFTDYVRLENVREVDEVYKEDERSINKYPLSFVSDLLIINTKNITRPEKEITEKIYVVIAEKDEIFPKENQEKAFKHIKSRNKKLVVIDADNHMMYTEYPEKVTKIINEIIEE